MLLRLRQWLHRLSLRSALILALVVGFAVPTFLVTWFEIAAAERQEMQALEEELAVMADILAGAMREPLWQLTPEPGRQLAKSMLRDARVAGILVTGQGGKPFIDLYRSVNALAPRLSERRSVIHDGDVIGVVQVTFSTAPMQVELSQRRWGMVWRFLGALLVSLALVLWVLHRWLLNPLNQLTLAAQRLPERHLDQNINLSRADELGQMANALNATRIALRDAFGQLDRRNIQLKAYAETLETRVEQRTHDLTETNERLSRSLANLRAAQASLIESEKLASLGRLVGGIAHEMNTPLGNSVTVVTELEDRYRSFREHVARGGVKRSEFDHFLDHAEVGMGILRRNVERATVLITHFKQVSIDQSSERRRNFDLAQVVEETLSTLQHRFKRSPFSVVTELTDGLILDSYPGPLEQVIIKLVENSLMHGFKDRSYGTVTVRAERLNRTRVRLVVRDDGVGMEPEVLAHVFDPFYGGRSDAANQDGVGLGMSIVHSIVTGVLGGRIDVQSKLDEGCACIMDLPMKAPLFHPDPAGKASQ